ncbi:hypothetical protein SVAN01_06618 [Stagonosporopsis vannaccii]|nr:hypothetical protein SVAN01_06618 [Stagonosporopsis vannaccii]
MSRAQFLLLCSGLWPGLAGEVAPGGQSARSKEEWEGQATGPARGFLRQRQTRPGARRPAIGALAAASHAAGPIAISYVIYMILFYAPFAHSSRALFAQKHPGWCSESKSTFIPPWTHGSKSIRASNALGTPSSGSCMNQTLARLQALFDKTFFGQLLRFVQSSMATRCPKTACRCPSLQRTKTGQLWSNCAERRAAAVAGFGSKGLTMSAAAETERVPWKQSMFVSRVAATQSRSGCPAYRSLLFLTCSCRKASKGALQACNGVHSDLRPSLAHQTAAFEKAAWNFSKACARHRQHGMVCERILAGYCCADAVPNNRFNLAWSHKGLSIQAYIVTIPTNARADRVAPQSGIPTADAGLLITQCDTSDTRTMHTPFHSTLRPGLALAAEVCVAFLLGLAILCDSTAHGVMVGAAKACPHVFRATVGWPAAGLVLDLPNQCSASWKPRWPRSFGRRFALPGFYNGPSLHEHLVALASSLRKLG